MSTPSDRQQSQADQSTLFAVGDTPPPEAKPSDFVKATERIYRGKTMASGIQVQVLPPTENREAKTGD